MLQRLTFERYPHNYLLSRALEQGKRDIRDLIFGKKLAVPMNSNLSCSCRSGNLNLVKETYEILSTDLKRIDVRPALHISIRIGNYEMINFLLEKGKPADLNYALSRSIFREGTLMMKHFIVKGADNFDECIILLLQRIADGKQLKNHLKSNQLESYKKYRSNLKNNLKYLQSLIT